MKRKNIVAMVTSLALVGVVAVGGTLALLSSTSKTLKNTFTVGDGYQEDSFKLYEHKVDFIDSDEDATTKGRPIGDYVKNSGVWDADAVTGAANEYDQVIPGAKLDKDPYFELKDGDTPTSWIVACVAKKDLQDLSNIGITVNEVDTGWQVVTGTTGNWTLGADVSKESFVGGQTGYIYFVYETALNAGDRTNPLFTQLIASATNQTGSDVELNIKGVAVQKLDGTDLEGSLNAIMDAATAKLGA